MWSVDRGPAADTDSAGVARSLVKSIHPGAVIDLHDGVGASAFSGVDGYNATLVRRRNAEFEALPGVIDQWRAAGYTFLTITELASSGASSG
jgi:peptidoglycan/xylan/chitin deacetylase (PgdA/CDA1 family)